MSGSTDADVARLGNVEVTENLRVTDYVDDSATAGNRTVNRLRGKNSIAMGAATVTITNSKVTANSQVICTLEFVDGTLTQLLTCVPDAGSFVVTGNGNADADTKFSWVVIN